MHTVYEAENIIDAMLVKHALEAAEIPCFVTGAHLTGALGDLPVSGLIRVQVPDSAQGPADEVVAALAELQAAASGADWEESEDPALNDAGRLRDWAF